MIDIIYYLCQNDEVDQLESLMEVISRGKSGSQCNILHFLQVSLMLHLFHKSKKILLRF